jgi:hypothetical protein
MPTFKAFFFRWILPIASTSFTSFPTAEKKQNFCFLFFFLYSGTFGTSFCGLSPQQFEKYPG